jgi:hypothetical protein
MTLVSDGELAQRAAHWQQKAEDYQRQLRSIASFDRAFVLAHASMAQRRRYHDLARFLKADAFAAREALAASYLAEHGGAHAFEIPKADGVARADLSADPLMQQVVAESRALYEAGVAAGGAFPGKGSLEFVGSAAKEYTEQSALFALARSPALVAPVTRYFGVFPILAGFGLTLARNEAFHRKSSQRLHFDPEDRSQIKAFIYVTDVDARSGPFMAAPAHACSPMFDRPDYVIDRHDDDVVPEGAIREFHGPAGTLIFCDTCRCLHGGARPGDRQRLMISIEYNLPSHLHAPLFPGDRDPAKLRTGAIRFEPNDDYMRALLGRIHV